MNTTNVFCRFLVATLLLSILSIESSAQCSGRYYDKIFSTTTQANVVYGNAINFFGSNQTLQMDIYQPVGDTAIKRPLVILASGGVFNSNPNFLQISLIYAKSLLPGAL